MICIIEKQANKNRALLIIGKTKTVQKENIINCKWHLHGQIKHWIFI